MTNVWRGHGNRLLRFHRLWKKNEIRMPESNVYGYMFFCFFLLLLLLFVTSKFTLCHLQLQCNESTDIYLPQMLRCAHPLRHT